MRTVELDSVDSTNRAAFAALGDGDDSVFVVAAEQTAGRGRLGRTWASPRGGVWCTLAWRVPAATDLTAAPLVAGLIVRDAVCRATSVDPARLAIKWPNDLLLEHARTTQKIAGVLCERPSPDVLLVGMGVNADFDAAALPEGLRTPATTLRTALCASDADPIDADAIARSIGSLLPTALAALAARGFGPFASELRALLAHVGETVEWQTPRGNVRGVIRGVDDAGRLLLETDDGMRPLNSGEVSRVAEME